MCTTIIFKRQGEVDTVKELVEIIGLENIVLEQQHHALDIEGCLCQIDVEKTLEKAGYTCEQTGGMEYEAREFTVKEILLKYLKEHGCDGLYNSEGECACQIDDLVTCEEYCLDCQPGYTVKCSAQCGEYKWCIGVKNMKCERDEVPEKKVGKANG